jgi:RNA binding exosome subunit
MSISFTKIEFNLSVHSTEDFDLNMEAIANLIPEELIEETEITVEELEGGHDNPIQYVTIVFNRKKEIDRVLKTIAERLAEDQKNQLNNEFDERFHFDGKTFFLRIEKEDIFHDRFVLASSENIIKISIKMRAYIKDVDYKEFLQQKGILQSVLVK